MNPKLIQKIRDIQRQEGNSVCFRIGKSQCPFAGKCVWALICLHDFEIPVVHLFNVEGQ
jgi:hypothetical protein